MRKRGFTLIELLIVIAIIAILTGVMMPLFMGARLEAKLSKAKADLDAIKLAAVLLHHDTDEWPPEGTAGAGLMNASGIDDWDGPYMEVWKEDPWGNNYEIYNTTTGGVTNQSASSWGPDETDDGGGNDDIVTLITPNTTL